MWGKSARCMNGEGGGTLKENKKPGLRSVDVIGERQMFAQALIDVGGCLPGDDN